MIIFLWALGVIACTVIYTNKDYRQDVSEGKFVGTIADYRNSRLFYMPRFMKKNWIWFLLSFVAVNALALNGIGL